MKYAKLQVCTISAALCWRHKQEETQHKLMFSGTSLPLLCILGSHPAWRTWL